VHGRHDAMPGKLDLFTVMWKPKKSAAELEKIFRETSFQSMGPWPANVRLIIYPLDGSWRITVGYSDAAHTPFRDKLMELSVHLRELYDLEDDPNSPWR
jgi:hypothetical protein